MNGSERTTAIRVFEDPRQAHAAVEELCRQGFSMDQIGFLMPEGRTKIEPLHLKEGNIAA